MKVLIFLVIIVSLTNCTEKFPSPSENKTELASVSANQIPGSFIIELDLRYMGHDLQTFDEEALPENRIARADMIRMVETENQSVVVSILSETLDLEGQVEGSWLTYQAGVAITAYAQLKNITSWQYRRLSKHRIVKSVLPNEPWDRGFGYDSNEFPIMLVVGDQNSTGIELGFPRAGI